MYIYIYIYVCIYIYIYIYIHICMYDMYKVGVVGAYHHGW